MKKFFGLLVLALGLFATSASAQCVNGNCGGVQAPGVYNGWGYQPGYYVRPGYGWNSYGGVGHYHWRVGGYRAVPYNYYNYGATYGYGGYRYPRGGWYVPYGW